MRHLIINPYIDYFFKFVPLNPTTALLSIKSLYITSLFKMCYNFAVVLSHTTFETVMLSALNTGAFWSYRAAMHFMPNIYIQISTAISEIMTDEILGFIVSVQNFRDMPCD